MKQKPLVSIIIPTYNRRRFLKKALKSILAQTHHRWEALVVDDGSRDGTGLWVRTIADPRIRLLRQSRQGPGAARNLGLKHARGEFVAFLDSDDIWYPQKLARQLRAFSNPETLWASSEADCMDARGRIILRNARRRRNEDNCFRLRHIWLSTDMFRRSLFERIGHFDPSFFLMGDDADLLFRLQDSLLSSQCYFEHRPLSAHTISREKDRLTVILETARREKRLSWTQRNILLDMALIYRKASRHGADYLAFLKSFEPAPAILRNRAGHVA